MVLNLETLPPLNGLTNFFGGYASPSFYSIPFLVVQSLKKNLPLLKHKKYVDI